MADRAGGIDVLGHGGRLTGRLALAGPLALLSRVALAGSLPLPGRMAPIRLALAGCLPGLADRRRPMSR